MAKISNMYKASNCFMCFFDFIWQLFPFKLFGAFRAFYSFNVHVYLPELLPKIVCLRFNVSLLVLDHLSCAVLSF